MVDREGGPLGGGRFFLVSHSAFERLLATPQRFTMLLAALPKEYQASHPKPGSLRRLWEVWGSWGDGLKNLGRLGGNRPPVLPKFRG